MLVANKKSARTRRKLHELDCYIVTCMIMQSLKTRIEKSYLYSNLRVRIERRSNDKTSLRMNDRHRNRSYECFFKANSMRSLADAVCIQLSPTSKLQKKREVMSFYYLKKDKI